MNASKNQPDSASHQGGPDQFTENTLHKHGVVFDHNLNRPVPIEQKHPRCFDEGSGSTIIGHFMEGNSDTAHQI